MISIDLTPLWYPEYSKCIPPQNWLCMHFFEKITKSRSRGIWWKNCYWGSKTHCLGHFLSIYHFLKKIDFDFKKVIMDFFYAIFIKGRKWLFSALSHTLRVLVVSKGYFNGIQTFRTSKGPSNAIRSQFVASKTPQKSSKSIIYKKHP